MIRTALMLVTWLASAAAIDCSTLPKYNELTRYDNWKQAVQRKEVPGRYVNDETHRDHNIAIIHVTNQNCVQSYYLRDFCQTKDWSLSPATFNHDVEKALVILGMHSDTFQDLINGRDISSKVFTLECQGKTWNPAVVSDVTGFVSSAIQGGYQAAVVQAWQDKGQSCD